MFGTELALPPARGGRSLGRSIVRTLTNHRNWRSRSTHREFRLHRRPRKGVLCEWSCCPWGHTYYRGRVCQCQRDPWLRRRVRRRWRCRDCEQRRPTLLKHHALIVNCCHDICTGRTLSGHEERGLRSANPVDELTTPAGVIQVFRNRRVKRHSEGLTESLTPRKNQKRERRGCPEILLEHVRHAVAAVVVGVRRQK